MLIMTFNLRFENDRDGENAWIYRREAVVRVIERISPAILGTQEGTRNQLEYLQGCLPDYRMLAPVRPHDDTCQYPTLFCRNDIFQAREIGEIWLSKTPYVHRSKDWDSAFPRMMNYCLLEDTITKRCLWVVVTHLDNVGGIARVEQARLIAGWLNDKRGSQILMGDFNDSPGSPSHELLTQPGTCLKDTWQILGKDEDETSMTHHDFKGVPQRCRMDWILVSLGFHVNEVLIVRDQHEGRYPSDHFPYVADLELI
jgi:endonuclease/exonuclease/phosphatase family metal-dependent hydrolase